MTNIAKFFINNAKLTIVLSLGLSFYGIQGLQKMNAESFPSVSLATATVTTVYDGATAGDIETKITKPLEDEIRGVTGLKNTRSISQAGRSTIIIEVDMDDPKVNVSDTMDEIQKAVDRVSDLPRDLKDAPEFEELKSDEFPVLELAVIGRNESRYRDLIADQLKDDIEDNKAVKEARLIGYKERSFDIFLDIKKLRQYHVSIDEVSRQVQARNTNTPGGPLRDSVVQKLVRIEGKAQSVDELKNLVVRSNFSGQAIRLKDIADVKDSEEEANVLSRYNGQESTLLIINKKAGADTLSLVEDLDAILKSYRERYKDLQFVDYVSEAQKVKERVDILASNALSGLVLVVIFLFLFLPGKIGFAASLSLPLAILGTLGLMPAFGMNIDAITVLALVIALGMMVDNSVVISENYTRLRSEGKDNVDAALISVKSLWLPISATAMTTIAAFLPMLVTKGVMGQFIKWIPIVVTIALCLSLLESFFFLPLRLSWAGKVVKQKKSDEQFDWFSRFEDSFEKFMGMVVRRRYIALLVYVGILVFSIIMLTVANRFILFPADQTEAYIARVEMPKGTRLTETHAALVKLTKDVKAVLAEDAKHIVARAGTSQMGPGDPKAQDGNNVGMLLIYVSDHAKFNLSYTEILKSLKTIDSSSYESLSFQELINGPPVGNPIEVTFRSNKVEDIDRLIDLIKNQMSEIPGVENLKVDDVVGDDEIFVDIDYEKVARLGLVVSDVGQSIRTAVSGQRTTDVTIDNKEIDLFVRLKEENRRNVEDLKLVTLRDPRGNLVELGSVANFRTKKGTSQIKRFDFKRAKTLTGDVDIDRITSTQANTILLSKFHEYEADFPGVSLAFGGAQESTNESMESLASALNLSLIGIFALLVFVFGSYLRPFIIMTTIPLGLFGFSIAFFLHGRPASFLALIGVIALGGIIVNSGIVLISFIDDMRAEGQLQLEQILARASGMRLRAVFVTSLTTVSGLLPTAYGIGGNDAILIPMTLAMAWGLTSGTVLTLIWVPPAYAIVEDFNQLMKNLLSRLQK